MFVFLDESGDLGFDFTNKSPSRFFVITLLSLNASKSIKALNKAISKALANKINHKKKKSRIALELKGNDTRLEVKKYFLDYVNRHIPDLSLYTIILDKLKLLRYRKNPIKDRVYDKMAHQLLEQISFPSPMRIQKNTRESKLLICFTMEFLESTNTMIALGIICLAIK